MLFFGVSMSMASPCATLSFYAPVPEGVRKPLPQFLQGNKAEREATSTGLNSASSDNFIVKWGDQQSFSYDEQEQMLESLEDAWTTYIEEQNYPAPYGSDLYLFNVYIGDTGSGTPSSYGAAGYYYVDEEWYPMIVLSPDAVRDPDYIDITVVHEFYHAIQDVNPQILKTII